MIQTTTRMKSTITIVGLVLVLLAGVATGYYFSTQPQPQQQDVVLATPTPDPMIIIDAPVSGATISSPLIVTGRARGNWYFEASFPVTLKGPGGVVLATVPAQAQGDWMTTDWVPFTATLVFVAPSPGSAGTLIFQKDNPSGEPQNDDSRSISIVF